MEVSYLHVKLYLNISYVPLYLWALFNALADSFVKYFNEKVFTHGYHHSYKIVNIWTLYRLYGTQVVSSENHPVVEYILTAYLIGHWYCWKRIIITKTDSFGYNVF